ncbi:hypothetical protein C9374_002486 [Naegleria lovaniensis]|uniref:F-box domain-containing protein n=1 Tax=Naegleria lovaniensis TaxID=51637 RepID=A0AA88KQS9_NAELO|nr:uncharacterized protein C9374_002486 [Naegleria lovaniensis]KAG2386742.1 hypothetical protein C9374_002486 [Naegleria lovaniensis]
MFSKLSAILFKNNNNQQTNSSNGHHHYDHHHEHSNSSSGEDFIHSPILLTNHHHNTTNGMPLYTILDPQNHQDSPTIANQHVRGGANDVENDPQQHPWTPSSSSSPSHAIMTSQTSSNSNSSPFIQNQQHNGMNSTATTPSSPYIFESTTTTTMNSTCAMKNSNRSPYHHGQSFQNHTLEGGSDFSHQPHFTESPLPPNTNHQQLFPTSSSSLTSSRSKEGLDGNHWTSNVTPRGPFAIFGTIPHDLLIDIFSFLDYNERFRTVRVVSHQWNSFIFESETCLFLHFSKNMLRFMSAQNVLDFVRNFQKLNCITIYGEYQWELRRKCIREIQATSPSVRELKIIDATESELNSVRDLTFHGLHKLYIETPVVTSNFLTIIHDLAPNITCLSLKYTVQEKADSLCKLYNNFNKLKELKLAVTQPSNHIYDGLSLSQLDTLEIHNFMGFIGSKRFTNLKTLNVSGSVNDIPTIVHLFPNITSLDISTLYGSNSDTFENKLCENLPKLQLLSQLTMTDCTTSLSMLDVWSSAWTTLKELDISRTSVNDSHLERLAKLQNLQVLKMRGLSITGQSSRCNFGDVLVSLQNNLTILDVSECRLLENMVPNTTPNPPTCFKKLKIFEANGANVLSEKSVSFILSSAPKLESLSLMACNEVKDETIARLCTKRIVYMDLRYCRQLGDPGFLKLVYDQKLRQLQHFKLALSFDVTQLSIEAVLNQAKMLKTLELNSCKKCNSDHLIAKQFFEPTNLPCLTHVDFSGTIISDVGLLSILTSSERVKTPLSNLVSLKCADCYHLSHDFLDVLDKYLVKIDKPQAVIPIMIADKKVVYFRCPYLNIDEVRSSLPRPQIGQKFNTSSNTSNNNSNGNNGMNGSPLTSLGGSGSLKKY